VRRAGSDNMNRAELSELIHNGESSGVEFKRDDVAPERLAKEMAALLNLEGGYVLLGVERDGSVSGLTRGREKAEEWVMEVARTHLRPAAIPFWETLEWSEGKIVDIELSIYADRLEVVSPRRLPNTVTVEKMRAGYRASRNELIKEVLRDYRYIEATGLGVPRKIIEGMRAHNGTEPDLIEEESRFLVRLWKHQAGVLEAGHEDQR
jgi:predicted HTH transcriptional regulator